MHSNAIVKDKQWLEAQVDAFAKARPVYECFGRSLEDILKKASKKHAPLAIIQVRPKALSSFAEKVQRKIYKYDYPLKQITDLCGARVITQTSDQIKAMCRFIEENFMIDRANSLDVSERLKPTEFGYRSVHYIVSFQSKEFQTPYGVVPIAPELIDPVPLKAEIQVRTLLEHAWADFAHDTVYKSSFSVPVRLQREFASLAASLERTDTSFSRIKDELKSYSEHYDTYMKPEKIRDEMEKLEFALKFDDKNLDLVTRIGRLAIAVEDWDRVIRLHTQYQQSGFQPVLRDLGIALCKKFKSKPASSKYREGQRLLEKACADECCDADTLASYAGTWKGIDDTKAHELYRKAYQTDPTNPYPLGNFLDYEIAEHQNLSVVNAIRPILETAIAKCHNQAEMGLNIPWAYFDRGRFLLLLGKPHDAMGAYAQGISKSSAAFMLETTLAGIERLNCVSDKIAGYEWVHRLLIAGLQARFPATTHLNSLHSLASKGKITGPVVIIAGGCDVIVEAKMQEYKSCLIESFKQFKGTVISGGTTAGISALAGEIGKAYPKDVTIIGYLPKELPSGVQKAGKKDGYSEIRVIENAGFSPMDALQQWIDVLCSGIVLTDVRMIGINGGNISGIEYRLALAFGVRTAIIETSGRAADDIFKDSEWNQNNYLAKMSGDSVALAAFLAGDTTIQDK